MSATRHATIDPRGRFALAESIDFGFGARAAAPGETVLRLAFVVDGYRTQAGVAVTQAADGTVGLEVTGDADADAVVAQTARVLSLDVDAAGWDALADRDALIGRLQAVRPGLRPPLFHSAYEAAAWSILSARRPRAQMAVLRDRLSAAHGATFTVAGRDVHAFPTPAQLLDVASFPGLPEVKLQRLHALARSSADGDLDTAALATLTPAEATERLTRLAGIGPFYASLVVLRALGHTDVPVSQEPRSLALLGALLDLGRSASSAEYDARAQAWRPWRTWAGVLVRAAGPRAQPAAAG